MKLNTTSLTKNARKLRQRMTKEELHLWCDYLRDLSVTVKRQWQIGKYIVDFYIPSIKLVIEIDGGQHYDDGANQAHDEARTNYLNKLGITVVSYTTLDIRNNFDDVCDNIASHLTQ